jgi:hypothetical protein
VKFFKTLWAKLPAYDMNGEEIGAVTPDDLIAAHIIEKIATDYESFSSSAPNYSSSFLSAPSLGISVTYSYGEVLYGVGRLIPYSGSSKEAHHGDYGKGSYRRVENRVLYANGKVNEVVISDEAVKRIAEAWKRIHEERKALVQVAKQAEAAMRVNEKKWNLVEDLLNMRRNAQGALVPKNNHPGCCNPYEPECLCECNACKPVQEAKPATPPKLRAKTVIYVPTEAGLPITEAGRAVSH